VRADPRARRRRAFEEDEARPPPPPRRSHASAYAAGILLVLGLYLGTVTILVPALLGLSLFFVGISFLSARLNPLSIGFYLTTKPSWSAIGIVFLTALALLAAAWEYFVHGWGPIVPALGKA
jgi:hypothetical protein